MDNLNSDLDLLENLSKKISDLIYKRIGKLLENNIENIKATEIKLQNLSKNHNKFNKRLKAYSSIKY